MLGVASAGVGWAIEQFSGASCGKAMPVVMITKGMHPDGNTLRPLPDIVQDQLRARLGLAVPVAAIGGPCIAGELAVRRHTGTVIVAVRQAWRSGCARIWRRTITIPGLHRHGGC